MPGKEMAVGGRRLADMALVQLAELLQQAADAPTREGLSRGALHLLREVFGLPYIQIFEVVSTTGEIRLLCCTHEEESHLKGYCGRVGEGILGHAAERGEMVMVSDAGRDRRYISLLPDVAAELAVPIRVGGEVRYLLNIEGRSPHDFDRLDRGLVQTLAAAIGAGFKLVEEVARREALGRRFLEERDSAIGEASLLRRENASLRSGAPEKIVTQGMVALSPAMAALAAQLELLRETDAAVLVQGETGTGKEMVARTLHRMGRRSAKPFLTVNAANLQSTLFESELFGYVKGSFTGASTDRDGLAQAADGGTLFLDEVGELSLENQAKLLRFLDLQEVRPVGATRSKTVDVRIISATNRELDREVREGRFREDLLYRLRVIHLRTPRLRERRDDIPLLILHFLKTFARRDRKEIAGVSESAMDHLLAYGWDGNVRELKNEMERLVALTPSGQKVQAAALSPHIRSASSGPANLRPLREHRRERDRELVEQALRECGWNVTRAATRLGITRVGLTKKLRVLGLTRPPKGQRE